MASAELFGNVKKQGHIIHRTVTDIVNTAQSIHIKIVLIIKMKIIFSKRAYLTVVSEATKRVKTETGGIFLGGYETNIWYVVETIEPGPKSVFLDSYFEYDREYTEYQINKKAQLYEANLTLIGNWHKHLGSIDEFSSVDDKTNLSFAKLSEHGSISIIANIDPVFRMTSYHVKFPLMYNKIACFVNDNLIFNYLKSIN